MYKYVTRKETKKIKEKINNLIMQLTKAIKNDYNIMLQHKLIGSAGKNMLISNKENEIDFDYNLEYIPSKKRKK